ncbi:MAG: neutral/alkaline non-lysosomal ceramidase N-terminal domain-containing protein [Bacteroidia bacterium]|nr:neutral/alkaline non-lysosomal ceramidase N-terminal domain-containing protein [Bacteroidia bacterium]MDW8236240.1 neutral/alkaline non-lysosomal ceramidase N-terminal domain-containing protein [Bacteroidia bacterium]
MWSIGVAQAEITYFEPGIGLMGWGTPAHVAHAVESHLYARAFCFQVGVGQPHFWIEADLCFIALAVWQEVFYRLRVSFPSLEPAQLMLTANHTHAAPGGYSHYLFYHITTPGFHAGVFERIVSGIVEAALQAHQHLQPAQLYFAQKVFPPEVPIAFNRAIRAYLKNPTASTDRPELAVDRTAYQITIAPSGHFINWMGTHTTSIQADCLFISSDHKGYAAELSAHEGKIGAFAQTTAGDVTPNFFSFPGVKVRRGPTPNPIENRQLLGRYQWEMAQQLAAQKEEPLPPVLRAWWRWVDFSAVEVEEPFTRGLGKGTTGEPAMGVAFLEGTDEGPGLPSEWVKVIAFVARIQGLRNQEVHGNKLLLIEGLSRKILGTTRWETLPLPFFHRTARYLHWLARQNGKYIPLPLFPSVLPIQLWQVGHIGILALPMEPTTMAGIILRERLVSLLAPIGIKLLIIQGYSNGYAGYLTTPWEYQYQRYEGAHTLFGRFTLAAVEQVTTHLLKGIGTSAAPPPYISVEHAKRILFTYELAQGLG